MHHSDDSQDDDFDDFDDLDDFDDPLLRALADAPPIEFGEPRLPPGTIVAQNYRILSVIGAGAAGVVYEATDLVLSRLVAIKLHEIGRSDRAARMWREARALARLSDPNVVTVHEVGIDGSRGFIAMELVEGTNARQWATAAPRSWREILEVYRQAGRGLVAAHRVGIVHRDFKPDNVLVGVDGRVRVADFGLAVAPDSLAQAETDHATSRGDEYSGFSTRSGAVVGTPAYMAPEQARGRVADARSDQYAFCVSLQEALHGVRPGNGLRTSSTERLGPAAASVPSWLDDAIARGLDHDPQRRYPEMSMLVSALDPAPHGRRRIWWGGAALSLLGGALLLRAGGWLAGADAAKPACATSGAAIDATWRESDGETIAAWQEAFADRPASLRDATIDVLESGFDQWAQQWRDAARDACEATHVHGQQSAQRLDQRTDCLERARRRFGAATDLYTNGEVDVDAMVKADAVVRSLPDVAMCGRPDAAVETDVVPLARQEVYDQLQIALDRAAAEVAAGHSLKAVELLDALVPALENDGFDHSLAEARRLRGDALLAMGRAGEAVVELSGAVALSLSGTDRDATASTMLSLARALGRGGSGYDEAMRLLADVRALGAVLDWSSSRLVEVDLTEFESAFFAERYDDVERIGAALLDDPALSDGARIRCMSLLATTEERRGHFPEALAAHDRTLAFVEQVRGPEHPQVAMVLGNRANALLGMSRFEEGVKSLERALAIVMLVFGEASPKAGEIYRQLGDAESRLGKVTEAEARYRRALVIHRDAGDESGQVFDLSNLSTLLHTHGTEGEAKQLLDEAIPLAGRAFGKESLMVARLLINRGSFRAADQEYAQGVTELEHALAILTAELPEADLGIATARLGLANLYVELDRADEAIALFEAGERVLMEGFPSDHQRQVSIAIEHANLLDRAGRPDAALTQWRVATDLADAELAPDDALRIRAWQLAGERLISAGRWSEASAVLERARNLDETLGDDEARTKTIAELVARARQRR